ncbi:MAG: hypothetical protein U0793_06995 [Gemmataceae bacterium]
MLCAVLIPKLQERFAGRGLRIDSAPSPCAVFPAVHPEFGDIQIYDEGDELTVVAGHFTHGHFSNYDDELSVEQKAEKITDGVVHFLEEVFADEVAFWGAHESAGGWHKRGERSDWQKAAREFVWSGPLP